MIPELRRDWAAFRDSLRLIRQMCAEVLTPPEKPPMLIETPFRCSFCGLKFRAAIPSRNAKQVVEVTLACPRCDRRRSYWT